MTNPLNNRDKSKVADMAKTDDLLDEIPEDEEVADPSEEEEPEDTEHPQKEKPHIEQTDDTEEESEESEEETEELEKSESEEEPTETKSTKPSKPNDIDTRYKEQRREAQLLHEHNKQLTDAFLKSEEIQEPTEAELKKYVSEKGADYDELTTFEKQMAKDNLVNSRRLSAVSGAVKNVKNIGERAQEVDTFIDDNERTQKHKSLIGRETEFRSYVMQSSHRGIPIDFLLSHFLMTSTKPIDRRAARPPLFATNAGGERPKTKKPEKITDADQAARLRTSDPRELKRKLLGGQIDIEV